MRDLSWRERLVKEGPATLDEFEALAFSIDDIVEPLHGLVVTIDGQGSVITTGFKGCVPVPFNCTVTAATLLSTDAAVTAGSIVIDVWRGTFLSYPPTVSGSICTASKPTLVSTTKYRDKVLIGWKTTLVKDEILAFNVDSVTAMTRAVLMLSLRQD